MTEAAGSTATASAGTSSAGAQTTGSGETTASTGTNSTAQQTGAGSQTQQTGTQTQTQTQAKEQAYDIKAPEGFDAAMLPKFVEKAKAYGLAPDKAQAWINDAHAGMVAHQKAVDEALAKQKADWHAELRADKVIGGDKFDGTIQRAQQIVDKVDAQIAPGIKKILADTGYGDHPAVVRLFAYLGEQGREDTFAPAAGHSAGDGPKTLAQLLYPPTT